MVYRINFSPNETKPTANQMKAAILWADRLTAELSREAQCFSSYDEKLQFMLQEDKRIVASWRHNWANKFLVAFEILCNIISQKDSVSQIFYWFFIIHSPSKCLVWVKRCCHIWLDQKGLFNLAPSCIVDGDFCLPNEIDSWNFQHMLLFWFHKASRNLSLFRQIFFS